MYDTGSERRHNIPADIYVYREDEVAEGEADPDDLKWRKR